MEPSTCSLRLDFTHKHEKTSNKSPVKKIMISGTDLTLSSKGQKDWVGGGSGEVRGGGRGSVGRFQKAGSKKKKKNKTKKKEK